MVDGDWFKGNIILIGDVVYVIMFYLVLGVGMVVEDVIVLVEEFEKLDMINGVFRLFMICCLDWVKMVVS